MERSTLFLDEPILPILQGSKAKTWNQLKCLFAIFQGKRMKTQAFPDDHKFPDVFFCNFGVQPYSPFSDTHILWCFGVLFDTAMLRHVPIFPNCCWKWGENMWRGDGTAWYSIHDTWIHMILIIRSDNHIYISTFVSTYRYTYSNTIYYIHTYAYICIHMHTPYESYAYIGIHQMHTSHAYILHMVSSHKHGGDLGMVFSWLYIIHPLFIQI